MEDQSVFEEKRWKRHVWWHWGNRGEIGLGLKGGEAGETLKQKVSK